MKILWVDKYRPATLEELVLSPKVKEMIKTQLDSGSINNCLFVGKAGIGKTTLAKIIAKELNAPLLYINAGVDGGVEMVRTKVKDFTDAATLDHRLKIVILDEADALSSNAGPGGNSSAQSALRNLIEEASDDTRFILTANYKNKIIDPLKSRCTTVDLGFTLKEVLNRVVYILNVEKIKYDKSSLSLFVNTVLKKTFPDIRNIVKELENWCCTGELKEYGNAINNFETVIDFVVAKKDYNEIRKFLIENEHLFNRDYVQLAQHLFNKMTNSKEQTIIAEHLYRMHIVTDLEIEFTAMMIRLKETDNGN